MFRVVARKLTSVVNLSAVARKPWVAATVRCSHGQAEESDAEFDARYIEYLSRDHIDGWEIRKAMNDLQGIDTVPDPKIVQAALYACRRVNDFSLAVRCLETIKDKCGPKVGEIWPYMLQELKPTLDELGILTPEEMGYDKPELALQDVYDIHGEGNPPIA